MCLMTEKQTPYTNGEIEEENMLTEVFNENDRLYSPFTVEKENKSTVTDNILLYDIGEYPDQQNKTVALHLQRIPTQFSSELPEDYSLLNKWKQKRDVEHMSDPISLENWNRECNNKTSTNKDTIKIVLDLLRGKTSTNEDKIKIVVDLLRDKTSTNEDKIKIVLDLLRDEKFTNKDKIKILLLLLRALFIMQDHILLNLFRDKEKKEHIRQMFFMLFIIFLIKNISDNVKYRQTSCRKYPSLNAILYLLWQSGDVEANPGPANSTMYRKWLYDTCSVVRKSIAGVPAECKMSNIWKKKPENWPNGESYFDPRNSKGLTVNKVEDFLQILIRCCDDTSKLSHEITSEIYTWNSHRSKDNDQLLRLYRTRGGLKSTEQIERSLKVLQSHLLPDETLTVDVNPCIRISLSCKPALHQQLITHTIYRAEATRKISSFLCRILHGKDPERKCDHIWTLLPDGWPSRLRYYNPNNGGERCAENEDGMVVEALITLCEKKSIILSKLYQDMVNAWQAGNQTLLSKLLTRHTAETDLKKAVMKLHEEGLLQDPVVDKQLRELGLFVQCDGSTQNVISQKRKKVNTMNKHETKRIKQSDHEDAVDTTVKELLPNWSIGQLIDNQNDSFLLEKIFQNIPDLLGDEADDIHFPWNQ